MSESRHYVVATDHDPLFNAICTACLARWHCPDEPVGKGMGFVRHKTCKQLVTLQGQVVQSTDSSYASALQKAKLAHLRKALKEINDKCGVDVTKKIRKLIKEELE